jgi:hypothetical protein
MGKRLVASVMVAMFLAAACQSVTPLDRNQGAVECEPTDSGEGLGLDYDRWRAFEYQCEPPSREVEVKPEELGMVRDEESGAYIKEYDLETMSVDEATRDLAVLLAKVDPKLSEDLVASELATFVGRYVEEVETESIAPIELPDCSCGSKKVSVCILWIFCIKVGKKKITLTWEF